MKIPPVLQAKDRVMVINTARKIENFPVQAIDFLQNCALDVVVGESLRSDCFGQFAASDELRLADLQAALNDDTIKAVFFARGGYGSVRILDLIDWEQFKKQPKWLIGYSDITYFHSQLGQLGIASLHAQMLSDYSDAMASELLQQALFNPSYSWKAPYQWALRGQETISGIVVGGNLSIVHAQLGSPTSLLGQGDILFLEDVHENLMSIERMLYNLRRNGVFKQCKAVVFGTLSLPLDNLTSNSMCNEFANVDQNNKELAIQALLTHFFKADDFAVYYGLPIGHEKARNYPVRCNAPLRLNQQDNFLVFNFY